MKKLFILVALIVAPSMLVQARWRETTSQTSVDSYKALLAHAKELIDRFLSNLPEESLLRRVFNKDVCSYRNDLAIAIYLATHSEDSATRDKGYEMFYDALVDVIAHAQLTPEEAIVETHLAAKALFMLF